MEADSLILYSFTVMFPGSCIVQWSNELLFVIGGVYHMKKTFVLDLSEKEVKSGPELNQGRFYHACHKIVVGDEDNAYIVVTGGVGAVTSTEIGKLTLSQTNWQWIESKNLTNDQVFYKMPKL